MDGILKKIIQLLESDNLEVRRSALRVLVELDIKDKELIRKLGERFEKDPDQSVRSIILDYAAKHPSKEFLPHLIESLKDLGPQREKVIHALCAFGEGAVTALLQAYPKSNDQQKRSVMTVVSGIPSAKSYEFLLDSMKKNHSLDHLKFVCYLFKTTLDRADKPAKQLFHKSLLAFYRDVKKDRVLVSSALILFGYLKNPVDEACLIDALRNSKNDFHQRKHALNALASLGFSGKGHDALVGETLSQLSDSDFVNIVRVAIQILEKLEISKKYQKELQPLLNSPHSSVRSFVLQKLSTVDSAENVDLLIKHLDSTDFRVKQAAQASLEKLPKAFIKLLGLFESAPTFERAEQLVQILKHHREHFKSTHLKRCSLKMEQLLRKGDGAFRHYLLLIRTVNPEFLYVTVMKKYKALKAKKKWLEASNCLSMLENVMTQNHELRLETAICKIMAEKIDYTNVMRDRNEGLLILQGIAKSRSAQELSKIILSDKKITEEAKYFIGFHFSEKQMNLKEFGTLILKKISKKTNKFGKLAKKKLSATTFSNQTALQQAYHS